MKKTIYWCVSFVLIFALSSCGVYEKHELAQYKIGTLKDVNYQFFAIGKKGTKDMVWALENTNVKKYEVTGYAREMSSDEFAKLTRKRKGYANRKAQYNVLLYINDPKIMEDSLLVHLDYTNVDKAEVYELNQGRSVLTTYLAVFGTPLAGLSLIGIIAVLFLLLGG